MNKLPAILAFLATAATLLPPSAQAQMSVSPLYSKLDINLSGPAQTTVVVQNGTAESIRFRANFLPFNFNDQSLQLLREDTNSRSDLSPYLRAAPLEFTVPANGTQNIRIIALIPPSALENELRSALVIEPLIESSNVANSDDNEGVSGSVQFVYQFITQIYASQSQRSAVLTVDRAEYSLEQGLRLVFANSGPVSGISNTIWQLKRGENVVAAADEAARYIVLPNDKRMGTLLEGLSLDPGQYTLTGTFGTEDGGEPPVVLNPQPFTKTFTVK